MRGGLVLLSSLEFSLGKHFMSVVTQVVTSHVSVCVWQPKFSLDHSVTSNLACFEDRIFLKNSCVSFSTMNINTRLSQV